MSEFPDTTQPEERTAARLLQRTGKVIGSLMRLAFRRAGRLVAGDMPGAGVEQDKPLSFSVLPKVGIIGNDSSPADTANQALVPGTSTAVDFEAEVRRSPALGYLEPYLELLRIFDPDADRDPEWIADNLECLRGWTGRMLSPFELLIGHGVERIASRFGVDDVEMVETYGGGQTIIISVPSEPHILARVTEVLAKYGLVPENLLSRRDGSDHMNMVLELTRSPDKAPQEFDVACGKFVAVLRQKLAADINPENIRTYSRPASRRMDRVADGPEW